MRLMAQHILRQLKMRATVLVHGHKLTIERGVTVDASRALSSKTHPRSSNGPSVSVASIGVSVTSTSASCLTCPPIVFAECDGIPKALNCGNAAL
jgi:hypothetical protein